MLESTKFNCPQCKASMCSCCGDYLSSCEECNDEIELCPMCRVECCREREDGI